MRNILLVMLLLMLINTVSAQCLPKNGIMGDQCSSSGTVSTPAFDVSIGIGLIDANTMKNIMKVDFNYITKSNFVYGGSIGIRPHKIENSLGKFNDGMVNGFLGYNLCDCAIVGCSFGVTRTTEYFVFEDEIHSKKGVKSFVGMSIKLISTYTSFPITFGAYGSSSGIGVTIGTIF
jgi:hypothetical protein